MNTKVQFQVDEETRLLAQQMLESQGRTLDDAFNELTQLLAEQQRQQSTEHSWLMGQINSAFDKLTSMKSMSRDN